MHEWGIVGALIEEVIKRAKENGLEKIDRVYLSLGEDGHPTPDALKFCFRILSEGTLLERAELEIRKNDESGIILTRIEGSSRE